MGLGTPRPLYGGLRGQNRKWTTRCCKAKKITQKSESENLPAKKHTPPRSTPDSIRGTSLADVGESTEALGRLLAVIILADEDEERAHEPVLDERPVIIEDLLIIGVLLLLILLNF